MSARDEAVSRVISEAAERVAGVAWSDLAPCRCWTEPARMHAGHCCMATSDLWCHQVEGMAALDKQEAAL